MNCGELWKRCHAPAEVRSIQDTHIQARISQFRDNSDGIDVFKCPVVKEYYDSGRADRIDQSTEGACTVSEVSFTPFLPYYVSVANSWKKWQIFKSPNFSIVVPKLKLATLSDNVT